jgi:hypothetical protein
MGWVGSTSSASTGAASTGSCLLVRGCIGSLLVRARTVAGTEEA